MASHVYPQPVLPGQSPPLAVVTEHDHRAWIYIAASLGVSMTLLSSAIRVFIRYGAAVWGLDDFVLATSTIISFFQSATVLAAASHGLGSSSMVNTKASLDKAQQLYYASNMLYVLALGLSRQSLAFFLRRVTPVHVQRKVITLLLGFEAVWTLAFFMTMALQCDLSHPWILTGSCAAGWFVRWEAMEISGAILELAILVLAVWTVVWNLQVAYSKRATIAIAFGVRTFALIIFIGLRLSSFDKAGFTSDPTLHEAAFICWTQAEMSLSTIAATVPIAPRFLASLVTYYGGAGGRNLSQSTQGTLPPPRRRFASSIIKMASFQSGRTARSESTKSEKLPLPREAYMSGAGQDVEYRVGVEHRDHVQDAVRPACESQRMMIRKDVTYKIEYD